MDLILAPECAAFMASFLLMAAIGALEVAALLFGFGASEYADDFLGAHFDLGDGVDGFGGFLSWLHVGRAPLLALLVLFLMGFSLIGYVGQWVFFGLSGSFAPGWLAAMAAAAASLPFVRATGGAVARFFPKSESSAVSEDAFIGKSAVVTGGEARPGSPAEARLTDNYGQLHYLRVEPEDENGAFQRGESVRITSRVQGSLYRAKAENA